MAFLALPVLVLLAQQPPPSAPGAATTDGQGIEDNSFLIEEAYNQDWGVVQHISTFLRDSQTGAFAYAFTQEWPFDPKPAHQLSYTVTLLSPGDGGTAGIGDVWFNWRYQVMNGVRVAVAPRVSVSAPSGDAAAGRGAGHAALQFALPVSVRSGRRLVLHSNAGATFVPHAQNAAGDRASTSAVALGQSAVWLTTTRFNALVEVLLNRQQTVTGAGRTAWTTDVLVSPGVRWAYNFANGLQIVPGLAVPVTVHGDANGDWSLLGYLSFEHPFARR